MADLNVALLMKLVDGVTGPVKRISDAVSKAGSAFEHYHEKAEVAFDQAAKIKLAGEGLTEFAHKARELSEVPIKEAEGLQQAIIGLGVEAGISDENLNGLLSQVNNLAAGTEFTATKVAQGLTTMKRAGFDAGTSLEQLPRIMEFASGHMIDLGSAATMTGNIMKSFKVPANETEHVLDLITVAARKAGTTAADFGEGLNRVAQVARVTGTSLDDTASLMAMLGKAGLNGERGAAALHSIMSRIAMPRSLKQSEGIFKKLGINAFDAHRNLKNIPELLAEINLKTEGLGNVTKQRAFSALFGRESAASVGALFDALKPAEMAKFTKSVENSDGATKKLSESVDKAAIQAEERLDASLKTLYSTLGTSLLPAVTEFRSLLADMIGWVTKFATEHSTLTKVFMMTAGAVGVLSTVLAGFVSLLAATRTAQAVLFLITGYTKFSLVLTQSLIPSLLTGISTMSTFIATAAVAAAPFIAIAAAIGSVSLAIAELVKHWNELNVIEGLRGMLDSFKESGAWNTFKDLTDVTALATDTGLISSNNAETLTPAQAQQNVKGTIEVQVTGDAKVKKVDMKGPIGLDVSHGLSMVSP